VPRRKAASQPAEAKREAPRPPEEPQQPAPNPEASAVRGFWSGSLSFGLVSIPVNLITAQRTSRVALRMLGPDGTPLKRRFFCSKHDQALESADIVRGYEVEKERFVVVTDDELKALAPKLSQEIDLTRFVPLEDIDPMHFEHGYFLVPNKKSGKAYRLLARIMEDRKRAGIATFVMRGKQYLVAIIASGGVLRAETLRFADELRSTDEIGVAPSANANAAAVGAFETQIDALRADALAPDELDDTHTQRLLELIDKKRSKGTDVIAARDVRFEDSSGAQIVDLLQFLKESIAGAKNTAPAERKRPRSAARDEPAAKRPAAKKRAARGGG
jgi:DNA end-binding protein Ku